MNPYIKPSNNWHSLFYRMVILQFLRVPMGSQISRSVLAPSSWFPPIVKVALRDGNPIEDNNQVVVPYGLANAKKSRKKTITEQHVEYNYIVTLGIQWGFTNNI